MLKSVITWSHAKNFRDKIGVFEIILLLRNLARCKFRVKLYRKKLYGIDPFLGCSQKIQVLFKRTSRPAMSLNLTSLRFCRRSKTACDIKSQELIEWGRRWRGRKRRSWSAELETVLEREKRAWKRTYSCILIATLNKPSHCSFDSVVSVRIISSSQWEVLKCYTSTIYDCRVLL